MGLIVDLAERRSQMYAEELCKSIAAKFGEDFRRERDGDKALLMKISELLHSAEDEKKVVQRRLSAQRKQARKHRG